MPLRSTRGNSKTIFGTSPSLGSHSAGTASRSPSRSREKISARTTVGKRPALCRLLRRRSIAPSASSSFKTRFSPILSEPLMPKARAISRLPILDGVLSPKASRSRAMKAKISSRVGSAGRAGLSAPSVVTLPVLRGPAGLFTRGAPWWGPFWRLFSSRRLSWQAPLRVLPSRRRPVWLWLALSKTLSWGPPLSRSLSF